MPFALTSLGMGKLVEPRDVNALGFRDFLLLLLLSCNCLDKSLHNSMWFMHSYCIKREAFNW